MNQDQVLGVLRNLIALGGGFALGHGYLSGEQITLIGGVLTAAAPVVWTYFSHTDGAKLAAAAALPDVRKIVVAANSGNGAIKEAVLDPTQTKITSGP